MATPKRNYSGQRTAPSTDVTGVAPLGTVRRSQLISTYGIGAVVDLEKGSFMPMGLDDWDPVTRSPSLAIYEARLAAQLNVDHFRLAPVATELRGGQVDSRSSVPAVRFPRWHECPQCHRIGQENQPFQVSADGNRLECTGHGRPVATTPVRFVLACRNGHINEFPWVWWAHRKKEGGECEHPLLELKSHGKSAALADLYVHCRTCRASATLGDAFGPETLKGHQCSGFRPWLHDRQAGCRETPRVLQRGASNVHFSVVVSALSIPPVSEGNFQIIEGQWMTLSGLPAEAVTPVLTKLAQTYGIPVEGLIAAFREKQKIEGASEARTDAGSRQEEYSALSLDRDDSVVGGIPPNFTNQTSEPPPDLAPWFDLVGAVSRLREVRAFAGFTRIDPFPVSGERVPAAIRDGHISAISKRQHNWLPAAEIRGEGVFLRFRTEAIDGWIAANPAIAGRVSVLERRSRQLAEQRGYERDYQITARLLLVHSFAHALIRTISIDCGYSASALRERLYVREADKDGPAMNGVLIYTGSPDSEGSLGGLVRLARAEHISRLVARTIRSAHWCGSDPVCLESDPEQRGDRVSGAACHTCLLVPETACEKFNRELDRTMLVGSAPEMEGTGWAGFFDDAGD